MQASLDNNKSVTERNALGMLLETVCTNNSLVQSVCGQISNKRCANDSYG